MAKSNLNDQIKRFMLNFKTGQLLGVDIGASSIKLALLTPLRKNNYRIESFSRLPLSEACIIEDEIQKPEEIEELLRNGIADIKYTDVISCLGIDGQNTMTKRMQIPDGSRDEIEDNVLWEAEQYIPFGVNESEVDYQILGNIPEEDDIKDIIVSAAKLNIIENFVTITEASGLKVRVVDLKVFAITNAFESIYEDSINDLANGTIIIDFGAQTTKIIVYKMGAPILTKEVLIGGVLVTEEIQRQMGVSYYEAEDLKINGDHSGNLPEEIIPIINAHLEKLMNELKKVLNFFIAAGSSEQVGNCFMTGGSSRLPGVAERLEEVVGVKVNTIDPFRRWEVSDKIPRSDYAIIKSSGLVALGLGMRKI